MDEAVAITRLSRSHPSRGAWIEIVSFVVWDTGLTGRTPHGVRGLKFTLVDVLEISDVSHPSRGAWIEIEQHHLRVSHPGSHPSRGAWIEIVYAVQITGEYGVAPLTGCVD